MKTFLIFSAGFATALFVTPALSMILVLVGAGLLRTQIQKGEVGVEDQRPSAD